MAARSWLAFAFALAVQAASLSLAHSASLKDLAGEWKGTYRCLASTADLTLIFKPNGAGRFIFSYRNGSAAGEYELSARALKNGAFRFKPGKWIKKPKGARTVGLQGQLSGDGGHLSGLVFGCSEFSVERVGAPAGSVTATDNTSALASPENKIVGQEQPEAPAAPSTDGDAPVVVQAQPPTPPAKASEDSSLGDNFKAAFQDVPPPEQEQKNTFNGSGELILAGLWTGQINCGANGNKPLSIKLTPFPPGTKGEMTVWNDAVDGTPALRFTFKVDKLRWTDRAEVATTDVGAALLNMPHVKAFKDLSLFLDNFFGKGQPFPDAINVSPKPNWGCSTYATVKLSQAATFALAQSEPLRSLPEVQKLTQLDPSSEMDLAPCAYSTADAAAQCLLASYRIAMRTDTSVATGFISHTLQTIIDQREIQTCAIQRRLLENDDEEQFAACLKSILDTRRTAKMAQTVYPVIVLGMAEPTQKSGGFGKFQTYQLGVTARSGNSWEMTKIFSEVSNALYFCKRDPDHKIDLGKVKDVIVAARTGMDENAKPGNPVEFTCPDFAALLIATELTEPSDTEGLIGFDKCGPDRASRPPLLTEVQKTTAQGVTKKMCETGRVMLFFTDLGEQVSDFEYRGTQCVQGAFGMPLTRFDFDFNAKKCILRGEGSAVCEGESVVYCESTSRDNVRQVMTCGTSESYVAPTTAYYKYDPQSCEWQSTDQDVRAYSGYSNR